MRTFIIDNNGEYSDHTVYFLRSCLTCGDIEALCKLAGWALLAVAWDIEWRDPAAVTDDINEVFYNLSFKAKAQSIFNKHKGAT